MALQVLMNCPVNRELSTQMRLSRSGFANAVTAKGGTARVVQTGVWDGTFERLKRWNYTIKRIRCRIGKISGPWKKGCGLRRMRWRGFAKSGTSSAPYRHGRPGCEIDFEKAEWVIPAERMKMRRTHRMPLAPNQLRS